MRFFLRGMFIRFKLTALFKKWITGTINKVLYFQSFKVSIFFIRSANKAYTFIKLIVFLPLFYNVSTKSNTLRKR